MDELAVKRKKLGAQLEELQRAEDALKLANACGEEAIPTRSDSLSSTHILDTHASTSIQTGNNINASEMLALPAYEQRKLSQQDFEALVMEVPSKEKCCTPSQTILVAQSSSSSLSALHAAPPSTTATELGPQSPSGLSQSPVSPAVDRLVKSTKAKKVSTVWDEDDIEALQIARTLAAHASALFPNQKRDSDTNETESSLVNAVTAAATKTSGVRSRIAAFETWSGGVPDGARSVASTVSRKYGGCIETVRSSSKLSVVSASSPSSVVKGPSSTIDDDNSLANLNARQSSLLRKALTKIQSLGADLSNEDDFKALAVTIVNSGTQIVNTGVNLATVASSKISEFLSKELEDEEAENVLINSYFTGSQNRASVSFTQPISSAPPVELPEVLVARHEKGFDIHDEPTGSYNEDETHTNGAVYRARTTKFARDRRQTMKAVDDLSKRASLLPTKDLLHRLNTVMADIQEFDLLDRDVGLVVAEDTDYFEIDRIVHTSLNDGSDFDEGEPRDENSTFSMVESENGHGGHDHATRDPDSGRHPAHLVKHLNRMSLYTASYVPSEGGFPYEDDATPGGIDLLAFDGRQSISVGGPAIPITGKFPIAPAVELVKPELNSFEGSTLANSTEAFPSRASSHAFLPLTITVSNNAPANLLNLESYNSLPRRATSPLVPSSQTPRALSPTSTIPRFSSSNFPSLKPSLPFSRHPTFPTLMNPPHSRSVSSPTPHHHTMSTLSAPVMSSGNRGIGATKASLLNSEDDLDAISGQVKLHTNRLFRAWQDTILVLSPRKRGLYYVKTGDGLTSSEQVVGFIELNGRTVAESVVREKGVANVFKGKPIFRVCQVLETESGSVNRKYFYFMAASNEDRDRWVDALQNFLTTLQKQLIGQYGDTNNPRIFTRAQSIRSISSTRFSPEELQGHLLKQQKLLAQQRALMAAVAAQVQFQEEITSELQYAQHQNQYFSYPRPGTSTSSYGVVNGGSPEPIAYVSDSYQKSRRPSDLLPPAMMRGRGRGDSYDSKKSIRVHDAPMFGERVSDSMGSGSDKTPHPNGRPTDRGSSTGYEKFGTSRLKVVDETGGSPSPIPPGPVTLSRTRTTGRDGASSPGLFSSWFGRIRSKDSRFE